MVRHLWKRARVAAQGSSLSASGQVAGAAGGNPGGKIVLLAFQWPLDSLLEQFSEPELHRTLGSVVRR